jgi:hypothetical protein
MRRLATRFGWLFVCGFLPLVALYSALSPAIRGAAEPVDFHYAFYPAAEAVLDGRDFLPVDGFVIRGEPEFVIDYVYPPLVAIAAIPFTTVPLAVAQVGFQFILVLAFVATLAVLGVRDWRCYGLAFLWPPVTDAIFTGNVTIFLGLAAALAWRYRDQPVVAGAGVGLTFGAKLFLWPLAVWLAATRRIRAVLWAFTLGVVAVLAPWGALGFRGLAEYPGLLRRLSDLMDERSYTFYALALDFGATPVVARLLWLVVAVGLLAACIFVARSGDERGAFVLAIGAAIAFSPIVWLHYFALLLVVVAVVQPRLGALWFIGLPLQLVVTTSLYNGSRLQTTAMLGATVLVVVLALRPPKMSWPVRTGHGRSRSTIVSSSPR